MTTGDELHTSRGRERKNGVDCVRAKTFMSSRRSTVVVVSIDYLQCAVIC